jgi:hypothetical protein
MSDRIDEIIERLQRIDDRVQNQATEFAGFRGELKSLCPEHARRIAALERRRNGNGPGATGLAALGFKTILALAGVIAALATIVSTLISRLIGAH